MKELRFVSFEKEKIFFTYEAKRVKNYNLRVRADGEVFVSAPLRASFADVERFVLSHRDFIYKAKEKQAARAEMRPSFQEGSEVFYRGVPYVLRIAEGKSAVSFSERELFLRVPHGADLKKTFRKEISRLFYPLLLAVCREKEPFFAAYGIPPAKEIKQRAMKSTWGNCRSREKILTFSTMLAFVPPSLLDYVICHEYAHFLHPDHSSRFYALLSRLCPDYKQKRAELKKYSINEV